MPGTDIDPIWFGGNALCAFVGARARSDDAAPARLSLVATARHASGESGFLLDRFDAPSGPEETALRVFRVVHQTESVALRPVAEAERSDDHAAVTLTREPLLSEDRTIRFVQWRIVWVWFSRRPDAPAVSFESAVFRQHDRPDRQIAERRIRLEEQDGCVVLVLAQRELDMAPTSRDLQKDKPPRRIIEAARVAYPASISDFRVRPERRIPYTDPRLDEEARFIRDHAWSETPPLNALNVEGDFGTAEGFFVLLNRRAAVERLLSGLDERQEKLSPAESEQRAALHAARRLFEEEASTPLIPHGVDGIAIASLEGETLSPPKQPMLRDAGWLEIRPRSDGRGVVACFHGAAFKDEIGFFVRPGEGRAVRLAGERGGELVTHYLFEVGEHGLVPSQRPLADPLLREVRRRIDALPSDRPRMMLLAAARRLNEILEARLSIYKEIESVLTLRSGRNPAPVWRNALGLSVQNCAAHKDALEALRRDLSAPAAYDEDHLASAIRAALALLEQSASDDPILQHLRRILGRGESGRSPQPSARADDRLYPAIAHLSRNWEAGLVIVEDMRTSADAIADGLAAAQFERNFSEALSRIWRDMPDFLDRNLHTRFHFDREPTASDAFVLFAASAFTALARKTEPLATEAKAEITERLSFSDFFRHPAMVEEILRSENLCARLVHAEDAKIEEPNAELAVQIRNTLGLTGRTKPSADAQAEP